MTCTSTAPRLNLLPGVWGKHAWMFLYMVALGYPNVPSADDKLAAKNMLRSLQQLLPCAACRTNFGAKMDGAMGARMDAAVQCSEALTTYIYDMEVAVAATTGKSMESRDTVVRSVMSNTYIRIGTAANAITVSATKDNTALWAILPVAVVATAVITWGVTSRILKNKRKY